MAHGVEPMCHVILLQLMYLDISDYYFNQKITYGE